MVLGYFDPGAGSLLLQALLGGAGGVVVLCRYCWNQLLLRRLPREQVMAVPGQ